MSDTRARYENVDHNLLYSMVMDGDPEQIDKLAAKWNSLKTDMFNLAAALNKDLTALAKTWNSPSGDEYHKRVGAVATFANTVAGEFGSVDSGLKLMSGPLREARQNAPDPAETADNDSTVGGVATGATAGAAVAGPFGAVAGGVIGGLMGHDRDEDQRKQARERMVTVVAKLADEYDMTSTSSWPNDPGKPPGELPGTVGNQISPISESGTSVNPHTVPATGSGGPAGHADLVTQAPHEAPIAPGFDPDPDAGSGLAGPGLLTGAGSGGSGSNTSGLQNAALVGGAAALGVGGLAAALGRGGGGPGKGAGGVGATGASAAGPGRTGAPVADPVLGREGDRSAASGTRTNASNRANSGALGGRGTGEEGDEESHDTWLTEDDMDWGAEDAPPSVLGGKAPDETPTPPPAEAPPATGAGARPSDVHATH